MKKGKLLNIALSIAFINILFVCFSIINVNAEEDTDTLNTNDESTVMESGWTNKENQWYYYDHGEKKTGWLHTDYWYYLDQDGKMVTGLASVGNQQYYFNQSGAMKTGWIQADGTYYYANNSGYIQKGWLHKGSWYYLDQDGKMATGLVSVGDEQYYFDQSGAMKTGWIQADGTYYYADNNGYIQKGWLHKGSWYYLNQDGKMVVGDYYINDQYYYFNSNGDLQLGWYYRDNQYYYLDSNVVLVKGWNKITNKWYYFNEDGAAVKDDVVIDGKTYIFRDDYSWISNCTRKEFVERAKRYLGCNEKDGSFKKIIDSYNKLDPLPRGYKVKYTDSWCMTFVSAIVRECNLLDLIPVECSCGKAVEKAQSMGIWQENDAYVPQIGDIIMYDWDDSGNGDNTGWPDHVGIVTEVNGNTFKVIEGNKNDAVEYRTMNVNSKYIRGFITPKFLS
ncbi:CHAP domain-containing protein [Coprobacillus sp. BIOML-A1]|nr:CHAP domain-containing protein [Coprobacillus sp. BIOML-A1]